MRVKLFILLLLLLVPTVLAKESHMHLLAVKELGNKTYESSSADLYLEIVPGSGHVFIETFPVTKVDTQLSTRFAKEVACSYLDVDCSVYDFKYRIKADSSIIGGPSAGASIAALTVASLKNWKVDQSVAVTGSISAGGLVGNVGALKDKIGSASIMNVSKVLVSESDLFFDEDNVSVNLSDHASKFNISVVGVSNLDDVIFEFTGRNLSKKVNLIVDPVYEGTMENISLDLCARSKTLRDGIGYVVDEDLISDASNFTNISKKLFNSSNYYSSASYCYRANINLKYAELLGKNYSKEEVVKLINSVQNQSAEYSKLFNFSKIETINDLQAYMIVKERLVETDDYLSRARTSLNNSNESLRLLAYAIERLYSVNVWSLFFDTGFDNYVFNEESVKQSCITKISEAQERLQYGRLYFPQLLGDSKSGVDDAKAELEEGNFVLCLFKASKARAEIDAFISTVGLKEENLPNLTKSKITVAEKRIARQSKKGSFPILAYSYNEYAKSLNESDPSAALLYSSYALEFSNLDVYFAKPPSFRFDNEKVRDVIIFLLGFFSGALVLVYYVNHKVKKSLSKR